MTTTDAPPVMEVRAQRHRDVWLLVGRCPYCHKRHTHGGGTAPGRPALTYYGDRVTHCANGDGVGRHYELVPAPRKGEHRAA